MPLQFGWLSKVLRCERDEQVVTQGNSFYAQKSFHWEIKNYLLSKKVSPRYNSFLNPQKQFYLPRCYFALNIIKWPLALPPPPPEPLDFLGSNICPRKIFCFKYLPFNIFVACHMLLKFNCPILTVYCALRKLS